MEYSVGRAGEPDYPRDLGAGGQEVKGVLHIAPVA